MSLINILLQIKDLRKESREELYSFTEYFILIMNGAFNYVHGLNPLRKGQGHVLSLVGN